MVEERQHMKAPSVNVLKKYLSALTKIKAKYVTAERLSRVIGVYPEVINETLSYFEPMLQMQPDYNLLELVPAMKQYVIDKEENKVKEVKGPAIKKKQLEEYESITDFIYRKMTYTGVVDRNAELSDTDLRILKKLIAEEQARRKKK